MDERMVEIAARAALEGEGGAHWDSYDPLIKNAYLREVTIAIQALLDAGYTILPPVEGQVKS